MLINKVVFRFEVSLHYELFFALQTLTDPESRIHPEWKRSAIAGLPAQFHRRFAALGASSFLWPVVADAVEDETAATTFAGLAGAIEKLPLRELQRRLFEGVLHDPVAVADMLKGRRDVFHTVARLPRVKQEWLSFVGLYPYKKDAPLARSLEFLLKAPGEFRKGVLFLLKSFWDSTFQKTWERLQPQLQRSVQEKERFFRSTTLEEFAKLALLRVEVDESRGVLKAVRGGFRLPLSEVDRMHFYPSCFNDKRHWTCYGEPDAVVCFPYFDPSISLDFKAARLQEEVAEPELDPALIFAALGDSTRYAMASLLARSAASSADLSRALAITRPSVSHHIHVLREAGLLEEKPEGASVRLSLKKEVFEQLSDLSIRKLFHSTEEIPIKKTRKK